MDSSALFPSNQIRGDKCYSEKNAKTEPIYLLTEMMESDNHREENKKHNDEVIRKFKKIVRRKEWKNFSRVYEN